MASARLASRPAAIAPIRRRVVMVRESSLVMVQPLL
jgi:hypothetical protein